MFRNLFRNCWHLTQTQSWKTFWLLSGTVHLAYSQLLSMSPYRFSILNGRTHHVVVTRTYLPQNQEIKKICSRCINFLRGSTNELQFNNHITRKICMCVVSGSVRLQILTISALSSKTCANFIFAFWQSKNIFGRIFISRICVWGTGYNVKEKDGRFIRRVLLPVIVKLYQVDYCYLLRSTFNFSAPSGPSAFWTPN